MVDLISIGDPTIDTFLKVHDAHVACRLRREDCQICFDYANKIPVEGFFRFPAGNMPNNAIGASRLGLSTLAYGEVGSDAEGEWIRQELGKEGVETKYLRTDKSKATNASTVLLFQKERTIFVWHETRRYQLPALPVSDWMYLTSLGPLSSHLETLHREILGYLKTHVTKLAFNPGTYQLLLGREKLAPLLTRSQVLIINKEEARELTGKETWDIKLLLRGMRELGPEIAVITDGPNGSFAYDGSHYFACGIYDLPVLERTGAGDAYATAFLAALHYQLPIPEAMRWGTFNAAYVVGAMGGILGLVGKKSMLRLSVDHPELKVKEI